MGLKLTNDLSLAVHKKRASLYVPESLSTGLIAAFQFEDNYTELHNGYSTGTIGSAPPFVDGLRGGKAANLRQTGGTRSVQIINPDGQNLYPGTGNQSMSMWIKIASLEGAVNWPTIYQAKGSVGTSTGIRIRWRRDNHNFEFLVADGTTSVNMGANTPDIEDDEFHHIVYNFDATTNELVTMYCDGVELTWGYGAGNISAIAGNDITNANESPFFGNGDFIADNIFIWNRLLTTDEIDALYQGQLEYNDLGL